MDGSPGIMPSSIPGWPSGWLRSVPRRKGTARRTSRRSRGGARHPPRSSPADGDLRGTNRAADTACCATKWGEKGYTQSLKAAYKGTSVKVVGVYPGGIDTAFYRDSHDYVSEEKQHTFMDPGELARVILFNLVSDANLTVSDILIERNCR